MYVQRENHEQNKSSFKQLGPKCWPNMMATLKRICQLVFVRTEVCVLTYILVIIIYTYHIGTTNSSCKSKVPVSLKRKPLRRSKKKNYLLNLLTLHNEHLLYLRFVLRIENHKSTNLVICWKTPRNLKLVNKHNLNSKCCYCQHPHCAPCKQTSASVEQKAEPHVVSNSYLWFICIDAIVRGD